MRTFKNYRLLASGLVIVALALYGVDRGRSVAQAAGTAPVLVTNTGAAQAVPVSYPTTPTVNIGSLPSITGSVGITGTPTVNLGTGNTVSINGSVQVGNSESSPVLVRDVDNPTRHAFQISGNLTLADGTSQGSMALTTVPNGKRLVTNPKGGNDGSFVAQGLEDDDNVDRCPAGVEVQRVCFNATFPGDTVNIPTTGTLFHCGRYNRGTRVVVLLSGINGAQAQFDLKYDGNPAGQNSFARLLAKEGYVVITYDTPGTVRSPYPIPGSGFGFHLNTAGVSEMAHQVVQEIRTGSYSFATSNTATCPSGTPAPFGSHHVIVGGISLGGAVSVELAANHPEDRIEALVSISDQNADESAPEKYIADWAAMQPGVEFPLVVESPDVCRALFFYTPGASPAIYNAVCGTPRAPRGVIESRAAIRDRNQATNIAKVLNDNRIPVLRVWGDQDPFVPPPFFVGPSWFVPPPQADLRAADEALWRSKCQNGDGCVLDILTASNASHLAIDHLSTGATTTAIVTWLRQHVGDETTELASRTRVPRAVFARPAWRAGPWRSVSMPLRPTLRVPAQERGDTE